jgi:hypothetical protein
MTVERDYYGDFHLRVPTMTARLVGASRFGWRGQIKTAQRTTGW